MAPKTPLNRKLSVTPNVNAQLPKTQNAHEMPPPPDPPHGMLVPEINALSRCMQNMTVKTGQMYTFFADARRLGIHKHTLNPPRSLTASLGREVEKYDKLCDALDSHLSKAISVLQRDLERERERIRAEEYAKAETARKEKEATNASVEDSTFPPHPLATSPTTSSVDLQASPVDKKPLLTPARRASTISLSSLHRTPFPHKLDLSSIAFNPDDAIQLHSGQTSPVTLAPKSSILRASIPPPDLLTVGQAVDIDLTLDDDDVAMSLGTSGDPTLGTSVDKPIELDLDDLFTDSNQHVPGMPPSGSISDVGIPPNDAQMTDIFNALQTQSGSDAGQPPGSSIDFTQLMQSTDPQTVASSSSGSLSMGFSEHDLQGIFNVENSDNFSNGPTNGA